MSFPFGKFFWTGFFAGALLLAGAGCSAFRAAFSTPPGEGSRRMSSGSRSDRSSAAEKKARRDPVADLFRFRHDENREYLRDADLSDRERRLLRQSLKEDHSTDAVVEQIHENYRKRQRKIEEDVFGPLRFR